MTSSYPGGYVPGTSAPTYPAGPGPGQPEGGQRVPDPVEQADVGGGDQAGGGQAGQIAGAAKEQASQIAGSAKEQAGQIAGSAKEQAGEVASTAREQAGALAGTATESTRRVAGEATAQARDLAEEVRSQLAEQAQLQQQKLAGTLRQLADELASMANAQRSRAEYPDGTEGIATDLVRQASEKARTIAQYIDDRTPGDLLEELRGLGRRRPGAFLVGAAALGTLAGRLTKVGGQAARIEGDAAQEEPGYEPAPPPIEDPQDLPTNHDTGGLPRADVGAGLTAGTAAAPSGGLPDGEAYPDTSVAWDPVGRSGV